MGGEGGGRCIIDGRKVTFLGDVEFGFSCSGGTCPAILPLSRMMIHPAWPAVRRVDDDGDDVNGTVGDGDDLHSFFWARR